MDQLLTFEKLLQAYPTGYIPYAKLLLTEEWVEKRQQIIKRDGLCCKKCGKKATENIDGKNVWVEWVIIKDCFIDDSLKELGWTTKDVMMQVEIDELQVTDSERE